MLCDVGYMERLSNEETRAIWDKHYPKRLDDVKSKVLCMSLCVLVEHRAAASAIDDENVMVQVYRVLHHAGIPRQEFYN